MNTVAVKKRRKSHLSKKESQGIDPSNNTKLQYIVLAFYYKLNIIK